MGDMIFKRWRLFAFSLFVPFLVLNGIAFMQARSMTHFVDAGKRTAKPEKLSLTDKVRVILTGVEVPRPQNQATPTDVQLVYETIIIPIQEESLEAWYVEAPKVRSMALGRERGIVLLFPPYGGSKAGLLAPTKILHELGYAVLLVDFRGTGGSSGSDTTLGVREAKDVAAAVAFVQRRWADKPVILYGASMGAVAVMRAVAIERVQPQALILESPFDRLLHTVRHRFEAMGIPSFPSAELIVFWGGVQQNIDGFHHNPADYARQIHCPVLLLHGEGDRRVTVADATRVFDNLAGTKQWLLFPNANGHGSLATDDGEQWRKTVSRFLRNQNFKGSK
jgi:uncharacterized protein